MKLRISRSVHAPSAAVGHPMTAVRVLTSVTLRTHTGWTRYRSGVVDTGAAVSLFPGPIWRDAGYEPLGRVVATGVAGPKEGGIPALLTMVECVLSDGDTITGPLRVAAYLADSDEAPLLIGMSGLIERGVLRVDASAGDASFALKPPA